MSKSAAIKRSQWRKEDARGGREIDTGGDRENGGEAEDACLGDLICGATQRTSTASAASFVFQHKKCGSVITHRTKDNSRRYTQYPGGGWAVPVRKERRRGPFLFIVPGERERERRERRGWKRVERGASADMNEPP